jgi:DNA-binding protein HU-beta
VNKRELVNAVAVHTDTDPKTAMKVVDGTVDVILATVAKGEVVSLAGFAKFERKSRPARVARNPQTGAAVKVPAKKVAKITALKGFKDVALGAAKPPKLGAVAAKQAPARATAKKASATATKAPATGTRKRAAATKAPASKAPAKKATGARSAR